MKEDTLLLVGILATVVIILACIFCAPNHVKHEEEMARQGYEQVVSDGQIVWQKRKDK